MQLQGGSIARNGAALPSFIASESLTAQLCTQTPHADVLQIEHSEGLVQNRLLGVLPFKPPRVEVSASLGNVAKRAVRNLGDMVGEEVALTVQARSDPKLLVMLVVAT